jgi:hypothetical protein
MESLRLEVAKLIAEHALGVFWEMLPVDRRDARAKMRAVDGWVDYGAHQDELLQAAEVIIAHVKPSPPSSPPYG